MLFPGLFHHKFYLVQYLLPLAILVSLSVVKTKGQIEIVYVEELWIMSLSMSKISGLQSSDMRICICI